MLGSASPTGYTDPWPHTFQIRSTLADPAKAANLDPNRVVVKITPGHPGSLQVRRVLTNTTTDTATSMTLRITTISEANGLTAPASAGPGTKAQIRATNPATPTSTITVAGAPVRRHPATRTARTPSGTSGSTPGPRNHMLHGGINLPVQPVQHTAQDLRGQHREQLVGARGGSTRTMQRSQPGLAEWGSGGLTIHVH